MAVSGADGHGRRILIVDDERAITSMLDEFFSMQGYTTLIANDGEGAIELASGGADVVLLDVNMPGMDGFETCRRLRERLSCPIIFLTARIEDVDQLDGFAAGADDYVLKPFSLEVLGGRVAAHLARESRHRVDERSVRCFKKIVVNYAERTVVVDGEAGSRANADLTRIEFDIVALLSKNPGRVYDRDMIYDHVWGWDAAGDASIVREHIRRVRKKLFEAGLAEDCIETVWGVGYRWCAR